LIVAASTGCRREVAAVGRGGGEKQAATRGVAVPVDGMICQICAGRVKSALKAVHGVSDVEVSLERRNAVIRYEEAKLSPEQLTRTISELGYKVGVPTPVDPQ
jgi:copper chaperone CopZ